MSRDFFGEWVRPRITRIETNWEKGKREMVAGRGRDKGGRRGLYEAMIQGRCLSASVCYLSHQVCFMGCDYFG